MNIFKWKKSKKDEKPVKSSKTTAPAKAPAKAPTKAPKKAAAKAPAKTTAPAKAPAKAPKKAAAKTKAATSTKKKPAAKGAAKQPTNTYYLTTREENGKKVGWEIKRGNAEKVSAVVPTKEAAKQKVKELAKNSKATVIIYKMDGSVEETYKINE